MIDSGETWTCPGCAKVYSVDVRTCSLCRVTQVRPRSTKRYEREVKSSPKILFSFPCVFPDTRFVVGELWTSGCMTVVPEGFLLVSDKDGLRPQELLRNLPTEMKALGPMTLYLPKGAVKRVVHDRFNGYFIELEAQKIPIRLANQDAWRELDAVCDKLGVVHST